MSNPSESNAPSTAQSLITNALFVFLGSAGCVFVLGSLVMILIWIASGPSESVRIAEHVADSDSANSSTAGVSEDPSTNMEAESGSGRSTDPDSVDPGSVDPDSISSADYESGSSAPENGDAGGAKTNQDSNLDSNEDQWAGEPFAPFRKFPLPQRGFNDEDRRTYADEKYVPRYCFAPRSGTLAIVGPWTREIGFITHDVIESGGKEPSVKMVKLSGNVLDVDYKPRPDGEKILVSYGSPSGLVFIDAKTLEIEKKIQLSDGNGPSVSCPKDPQVDFAFAFSANGNSYKINVDTMEIENKGSGCTGPGHTTYDGSWVIRNWRGPIPVNVADTRGWSHTIDDMTKYNHSTPTPFIDPAGRFVALQKEIYTPNFEHLLGEFATIPEAASVKNSWIFGVQKSELILGSLNNGKVLKRFAIPKPWLPLEGLADHNRNPKGIDYHLRTVLNSRSINNKRATWKDVFRCRLFADDQRERLLIAGPDLLSIPYSAFSQSAMPNLWLTRTPAVSGAIGTTIEFDIPLQDESATIELVEAKGATMDGRRFRWTPTNDQFGKQTFAARVTKGNEVHNTRWHVTVQRRLPKTLPVPFVARGIRISNDEKMVVVYGHQSTEGLDREEARKRMDSGEIAVFDASSKELVGEKSFGISVQNVECCRNELLIAQADNSNAQKIARLRLPRFVGGR